jgi:hypothetical protein
MVEKTTLFSEAKLNMRSFATNNKTLLHHLSEKGLNNEIVGILSPALDGQQKALGLRPPTCGTRNRTSSNSTHHQSFKPLKK